MWENKYREIQPVSEATALRMIGHPPVIPDAFQLYMDSFSRMHSERQLMMGAIGPIPISKIMWYGEWIDFEDLDKFTEIIQELDAYFISLISESIKRQTK